MRFFAISDLHTDFADNWKSLQQFSRYDYKDDALLVAGDIADGLGVISRTLSLLRSRFRHVFYVPGNHELWVRTDDCHSIEKFSRIQAHCEGLGIHTRSLKVGGLWVVPLLSWYDPSFDDDESADLSQLEGWSDFYFCKWPPEVALPSEYFLGLNRPFIRSYDAPVISLSHFLPRRDLLPPTRQLSFKGLPRVAGCNGLDQQLRAINSRIHVFGHSHINGDRMIEGVRYVQSKFGYPKERSLTAYRLKLIRGDEEH